MRRDILEFLKVVGGTAALLGFLAMITGILGHCNQWDMPDWTLQGVFAMFLGGLVFILAEIGNN